MQITTTPSEHIVSAQGCAEFCPTHQAGTIRFTPSPGRASPSLRSDLNFRYTQQGFSRLDKKRGLVCSARVSDVGHIDQQREFGPVCFPLWQAKSEAAPATVGGESLFGMPLGFLGKAREGEEGL
jgi:hypothetical protein